jgi:ABC-type transport system substrate-binding protein
MLKVGEAQWAWDVEADNVEQVPKFASVESVETASFVVDTRWNANTRDLRFRQGLAHAIDCETIVEKILKGQGGCRALSYHPSTTGVPADLKPYPYDPEKARQLIRESGFEGSKVVVVAASESYTKSNEVVEAVISYWSDVGLDPEVQFVEPAIANRILRDVGGVPAEATIHPKIAMDGVPHMRLLGHTNDIIEPEPTWQYASCTMYIAWSCFPEVWQQMQEAMATPPGPEREKKLEKWHRWWYENLVHIPIHDIRPVYGLSTNR